MTRIHGIIPQDRVKTANQRLNDPEDPSGVPVLSFLKRSGLSQETIQHFNLMAAVVGEGAAEKPLLGIPWIYSGRVVKVRQFSIPEDQKTLGESWRASRTINGGSSRYAGLFNADAVVGQSSVVLCGDEFDCLSVHQATATQDITHPAVCAAVGADVLVPNSWADALVNAESIILWFDDSEKGQRAIANLVQRLGAHRCKIASIPQHILDEEMDLHETVPVNAQDCMRLGIPKADMLSILANALPAGEGATVRPSHHRASIHKRIHGGKEALGLPFAWKGLQDTIRGARKKELIYFTAHDKHGKTTAITAIAESFARQGVPTAICSLEGAGPYGVTEVLHQRMVGMPLSKLDTPELKAMAEQCLDILDSVPLHIINLSGTQKFTVIADHFRTAVKKYGCQVAFMDHLHQITPEDTWGERNIEMHISKTVHAFADLAKELDIPIFLVGHPANNITEDQVPTASSVKGGSSVKQVVDASFSVWRPRSINGRFTGRRVTLKPVGSYEVKQEMASTNVVFCVTSVRHREATTGHFLMDFNRDSQMYYEIQTTLKKPDGEPLDDAPMQAPSITWDPSTVRTDTELPDD